MGSHCMAHACLAQPMYELYSSCMYCIARVCISLPIYAVYSPCMDVENHIHGQ